MQKTKARPIILSADEVRAVLAGEKTQHRVIIEETKDTRPLFSDYDWRYDGRDFGDDCHTPDPAGCHYMQRVSSMERASSVDVEPMREYVSVGCCPLGIIGDQLWVQEDHARQKYGALDVFHGKAHYFADGPLSLDARHDAGLLKKYPASDMPRWASRLFLEITDIRIERLQDISADDAINEGCPLYGPFGEYRGSNRNQPNDPMKYKAYGTPKDAFTCIWISKHGREYWVSNPWVWAIEFEQVDKS